MDSTYLLPAAEIKWKSATTPWSVQYQDIYCDTQDGAAEKEFVFLEANQLEQKWKKLSHSQGHYCILETGFGFGLTFLQTLRLWQTLSRKGLIKSGWHLHYYAIEKHPIKIADLKKLYQSIDLDASPLFEQYPIAARGFHRLHFNQGVHLTLIFDDINNALPNIHAEVDSWFLDGFKPSTNPDIWSPLLFSQIKELSRSGATFSTYSSAGHLRRHATAAGLEVTRRKGFGKKAEMVTGKVAGNWSPNYRSKQSVTILGAGIAGLSLAKQFQLRGVDYSVFDMSAPMSGASGIFQLSAAPQLAKRADLYNRFSLNAFLYLKRTLGHLMNVSGVFKVSDREQGKERLRQIPSLFQSEPEFMQAYEDSLLYKEAGWFSGSDLEALWEDLVTPEQVELSRLTFKDNLWHLSDNKGHRFHSTPNVILATGSGSSTLDILRELPLGMNKGHSLRIGHGTGVLELNPVMSGPVSLFPPVDGLNTLSGGYDSGTDPNDFTVSGKEVKKLLTKLEWMRTNANPDWPGLGANWSQSFNISSRDDSHSVAHPSISSVQVAWRCISRDKRPLVDGIPDFKKLHKHVQPLTRDAGTKIEEFTGHLPGLWINTAYGSHGLTHSPLCSEYLVSRILDEPWPISKDTATLFSASRFALRDARKQKKGSG